MLKKFYIYNRNTCTRVKLYGIDVENLFLENGYKKTKKVENSDLVIINTCSFLKSKEKYFLDLINKINEKLKDNQQLVIIGCLPSINKENLMEINNKMILFGRDLNKIKEYFNFKNTIKTKATQVKDKLSFCKNLEYLFNKIFLRSKHIEYRLKRNKVCYLQISSGCQGRCTYCSERFTTKLKSRPINEILEAIEDGISRNYKLFGLNSDDASAYGKDINSSLEELLKEIVKIKDKIYFSIPEFNPNGLSKEVLNYLKDEKFLYITVPIQSGSQRILDLMQRPYKINEVIEKVKHIKENNKNLKINTHIIVGFPGEINEDFERTKKVIKTGLFDRVKVFMYNERPNTKAKDYPNKVPEEIKLERRNELLKIMKIQNIKNFSLTNLILNKEQLK